MKKLFMFLAVCGLLTISANSLLAQEGQQDSAQQEQVQEAAPAEAAPVATPANEDGATPLHQQLKVLFIDGGPEFMTPIVLCLILGLALVIERIIYLNLATVNTKRLLSQVEEALANGGPEEAKEVCRNTRGPIASIFYQGLDRYSEGIDMVEKSITSYGSVQMGLLEKNLSWIGLFIAIAPMLGFLGTVIGMVFAFDDIEKAGNISPTIVAGGMKVALITTVGGLVVAIFLQIFYNYILSKIESLVNSMEDASISLVDLLVKYNIKK